MPTRRRLVHRRTRHARVAVLTGLAAFTLAQLGLNVAVDTVRPHWRDAEFGHRVRRLAELRRADAKHPRHRPLLVILGSSRAQMGLSPDLLGMGDRVRAYNLSQAGGGPVRQRLNFDRLTAAGLTPDHLLVEVIPALLARDDPPDAVGPAGGGVQPSELSAADLGRLAGECDDFPAYSRRWLAGRLAPWHTYRRPLLDHWAGETFLPAERRRNFHWTELRPDGWAPFYREDMSADERAGRTAAAREEYEPLLADYRPAPRPDRVYRRLIADARAAGCRVGLLVMPEAPVFRGWYPPGVWAESRRRVRGLAASTGADVCDAGDWLADDTLFADGHHLLGHGAERFSRRLGEWLRDPE